MNYKLSNLRENSDRRLMAATLAIDTTEIVLALMPEAYRDYVIDIGVNEANFPLEMYERGVTTIRYFEQLAGALAYIWYSAEELMYQVSDSVVLQRVAISQQLGQILFYSGYLFSSLR